MPPRARRVVFDPDRNNEPPEHHLPFYCGNKQVPQGKRLGQPFECFKRGLKSGYAAAAEKGRRAVHHATVRTALETRQRLIDKIKNEGLIALRREIHLNELNQRELGGLAGRLHLRVPFVPHYSSLSKAALIDELHRRGFRR